MNLKNSFLVGMNKPVKIILNITAGLLLLSPFFFMRSLLYPFVLGKATLIQILIALTLPFLGALIFSYRRTLFKRNQILTWSVLIYALLLLLATITGVSSWQSFWGTSDRSFGVFTILHILLAYFVFLIVLKDEHSRRNLLLWAVVIGAAVSLAGIFEYLRSGNGTRITGFFGNPILFGGYLLFPLFFSLIFLLRNLRNIFWKRFFYFAAAIVVLFALFFAQSRGALIGAILGGLVAVAIFVINSSGNKKTLIIKILAIIGIAIALIFILERSGNRITISLLRRFSDISLKDASTDQRLRLYGIAFDAFKDRSLLGWGPENFDYAFDRNYNPSMLKYGISQTWADRSHNSYLDMLVTNGILGFAAYIFMFIAAAFHLRKSVRLKLRDKFEAGILAALLVAYGIYNFFAFDSQVSLVYFMFFLAYIGAQQVNYENKKLELKNRRSLIIALSLVPISLLSILFTVRNARAASHMLRFTNLAPLQSEERLNEAKSALNIKPTLIRDFRLRIANTAFEDAGTLPPSSADILLSFAIDEMKKNTKEAPQDFSYWFALGNLYLERGMLIDSAYLPKAEDAYLSAQMLSPYRQVLFFQLASLKLVQREYAEAVKILEKVAEFDPLVGQSDWRLGIAYAYNGQTGLAREKWKEAIFKKDSAISYKLYPGKVDIFNVNYAPAILKEVRFAADIATRDHDFELLRALSLISIELQKTNSSYYAQLAVTELELGNFSAAREATLIVMEMDPSAKAEVEVFLQEIAKREKR